MNPSTESFMKECRVCSRNCGVDRLSDQKGFCKAGAEIILARAALHMWEEPCISGKEGSGAVFFSGCSLGCKFCQNRQEKKLQQIVWLIFFWSCSNRKPIISIW